MEAIDFVTAVRQRVIEADYIIYQDLLNSTGEVKDPSWKEILQLYRSLTIDQRRSLMVIFRLVQVNTLSHVLGILDGSSYLDDKRESFLLRTEPGGKIINGDLQDIFLEMEEG